MSDTVGQMPRINIVFFGIKPFTVDATTNVFTVTAHGIVDNDPVKDLENVGGVLPGGLVGDRTYYADKIDDNTLKLLALPGDAAAIDVTHPGSGIHYLYLPADPTAGELVVEKPDKTETTTQLASLVKDRVGFYHLDVASAAADFDLWKGYVKGTAGVIAAAKFEFSLEARGV